MTRTAPPGSTLYVFGRHEFLVQEVFTSGDAVVYVGLIGGVHRASVVGEHVTTSRQEPHP